MRGRRRSSKDPKITSIRVDKFFLDVCATLGWQTNDLFKEGFDRRLDRLLSGVRSSGEVPVTLLPSGLINDLLEYTENSIATLKVRSLVLQKLKGSVSTERPEVTIKRKVTQRFTELAFKHIQKDEASAYLDAYKARIDRGLSPTPIVRSFLDDLRVRTNDVDFAISTVIKSPDPLWKENLVWNILIDLSQKEPVSLTEQEVGIRQDVPTPRHITNLEQ